MANTFKILTNDDIVVIETPLYESVPLTGTLASGTYAGEGNILNYSHGMFQSVWDYPYASSSANHLYDITCGYASSSVASNDSSVQNDKKISIYNQMAQKLAGYDATGSIQLFDEDGDFAAGGNKLRECIFLNFSRLLYKEEIKKGSFSLTVYTGGTYIARAGPETITDAHAASSYFVNSPAGDYTFLTKSDGSKIGLIYYQAGVVVLTASLFTGTGATTFYSTSTPGNQSITAALTGSSISGTCDAFRKRLHSISFNSTTKMQSTMIFLPVGHNDFNYSSNPTFLSSSRIVVKTNSNDLPRTYITTVGLFSPDNELLAVGKISEPIAKNPAISFVLRGRLDF